MKRLLDVLHRIIMVAVFIAILIVVADFALTSLEARAENSLVAFFAEYGELLVPNPVIDVLPDQEHWQTVLLSLAAYVVVLVLFALLFRGLRSVGERFRPYRARR